MGTYSLNITSYNSLLQQLFIFCLASEVKEVEVAFKADMLILFYFKQSILCCGCLIRTTFIVKYLSGSVRVHPLCLGLGVTFGRTERLTRINVCCCFPSTCRTPSSRQRPRAAGRPGTGFWTWATPGPSRVCSRPDRWWDCEPLAGAAGILCRPVMDEPHLDQMWTRCGSWARRSGSGFRSSSF